jgi:hypothetical protein
MQGLALELLALALEKLEQVSGGGAFGCCRRLRERCGHDRIRGCRLLVVVELGCGQVRHLQADGA